MSRYIIGQGGVIVNVVESSTLPILPGFDVLLDASGVASVSGSYDPRDIQLDAADLVAFKILFRHENLIRELITALRASSAAANTAATTAGLPTAANAADVTAAQFRAAVKSLL